MYTLREVTTADIPALLDVVHAAFEEYRGRLDPPSGAHSETIESLRRELARAYALAVLVDGEIVGCVFYKPREQYLYFYRLAVLPAHHRRGLGLTLITAIEQHARQLNLPRVRLSVRIVLTENRAYYERLGYRLVDYARHAGYTQPTYVILEKEVG
jgi:predicted N-acetyltransferase YhbS